MPEIQLKLDYEWEHVESEKGKPYVFPQELTDFFKHRSHPAVYQWRVHKRDDLWVYVGETESLARRVQGYLKPGPSQTTNIRIKKSFENFLERGYEISLDTMRIKSLSIDGKLIENALDKMDTRRAIENILTFKYGDSGIKLLNK